jgi:hypothetical protein
VTENKDEVAVSGTKEGRREREREREKERENTEWTRFRTRCKQSGPF